MSKRKYRITPEERQRRSRLMKKLRAQGRCGEKFLPHIRAQEKVSRAASTKTSEVPERFYVNLQYPELSDEWPPHTANKPRRAEPLPLWKGKK
jgi:hypothetical protein